MNNSQIPFPPGSSVVAYLRDSGGDEQDLSVAQQQNVVEKWCTDHGITLSQVFADVATPGSSTIGRSAFKQMISHFHDANCPDTGVILWKFSRFSRDIDDAQFYRADLRRRGFIVYSIQDNIPDSSDGRIYEALLDWMNSKFLEDLSVDVKRGLHHIVREYGAVPGIPPRGFKREEFEIGKRRDGSPHIVARWVPDETTWDKCKQAWEMRAAGEKIKSIHLATHLFASRPSYVTFFRNRLYTGELCFGDFTIPNYAPAMITQEVWTTVQNMNKKNSENGIKKGSKNHPRRAHSSFLLSGLLYCTKCGSIMNGHSAVSTKWERLEYYYCSNAHQKMDACDARPIPKASVENLVIESLREYVLDPKVIAERDHEIALAQSGSVDAAREEQKKLKKKLTVIQEKISNVIGKIENEKDAPRSLLDRLRQLETEEEMTRREYDRAKSIEHNETVFARTPQQASILAERVNLILETNDLERKRKILQTCIVKVAAERDENLVRAIIHFWNPEDSDIPNDDDPGGPDKPMPKGGGSLGALFI